MAENRWYIYGRNLTLQAYVFAAQAGEFILVVVAVVLCAFGLGCQASLLLLFSEVVESGVVDAFSAQDGGDLSSLGAGIGETKDAQFLFARVAASDRLGLGQMRLWREKRFRRSGYLAQRKQT